MNIKPYATFMTAALCLSACGGVLSAQSVKVNWRERAPFADYKTYTWQFSPNEKNSFYKQFVRQFVNEELAKKGLTQAAEQSASLIVTYHFATMDVMDSTTTSDGFGMGGGPWGGGWGGYGGWGGWGGGMGMGSDMSTTEAQPRTMGILTIDLVDAKTKQLVWRGQATEDSVASNQKGDDKQVQKSIDKMFDKFPPKGKNT